MCLESGFALPQIIFVHHLGLLLHMARLSTRNMPLPIKGSTLIQGSTLPPAGTLPDTPLLLDSFLKDLDTQEDIAFPSTGLQCTSMTTTMMKTMTMKIMILKTTMMMTTITGTMLMTATIVIGTGPIVVDMANKQDANNDGGGQTEAMGDFHDRDINDRNTMIATAVGDSNDKNTMIATAMDDSIEALLEHNQIVRALDLGPVETLVGIPLMRVLACNRSTITKFWESRSNLAPKSKNKE